MARRICDAACSMRSSDDVSASMPVRYDASTVTGYEITSSHFRAILQPWVNRLTLQSQDTEYALVDSAERFLVYESLQCFQS